MNCVKLKENYRRIFDSIQNQCEIENCDFNKLKVVTVTKSVELEVVKYMIELGARELGENRIQQLHSRKKELEVNVNWHMIGTLQSNKVKYIAEYINLIHSVTNMKLINVINREAKKQNRKINVLVELNTSKEINKTGMDLEKTNFLFENYLNEKENLKNVDIVGLMTMAPYTQNEKNIRNCFAGLRKYKENINEKFGLNLTELSMGMSNDYLYAIKEGATILRIGTIFFE